MHANGGEIIVEARGAVALARFLPERVVDTWRSPGDNPIYRTLRDKSASPAKLGGKQCRKLFPRVKKKVRVSSPEARARKKVTFLHTRANTPGLYKKLVTAPLVVTVSP